MRILFYDIETTPLRAWVWRMGEQVVRHSQLDPQYSMYDIICITYCWNDGGPVKSLDWGYLQQDSSKMIEQFDALVKQADVTLGKNSDRFDVKHINTQRLLHGLTPMPDWSMYTEDLEKQIRRHFALPSNSLDYLSNLLGEGGKNPMQFQDWIDIVEQHPKRGRAAFKKMIEYGIKDTADTRALWDKVAPYITPKWNMNVDSEGEKLCKHCGSSRIIPDVVRTAGAARFQTYHCKEHNGYAGRARLKKGGRIGRIT